jgi:hypothetical protein
LGGRGEGGRAAVAAAAVALVIDEDAAITGWKPDWDETTFSTIFRRITKNNKKKKKSEDKN